MLQLNTNEFDAPKEHLAEALGVVPIWVHEYNILGEDNIVEYMRERYGFGLYKFEGEVLEDGSYRSFFEEDEDLQWVGKMKTKHGTAYFYQYAITALPTDDGYFITRMD